MHDDQLRVRHFRDPVDPDLREIALDEADVAPAVLLFVVAVPVGDLRAACGGHLRQSVVVARPEHIADRPAGIGLEIGLHCVVFLHRVMPGDGEPFRGKRRFQNLAVVRRELEGQHIAGQDQLSQQVRKLIGRDPAVDDRPADRDLTQRQKPRQARAAKRAAIGRVQPGNAVGFQIFCDLVYSLLHGGEIARFLRLVPVKDHLKHVPLLRKQRDRLRKRPDRLRRARQKQQRPPDPAPMLQNLHVPHLTLLNLSNPRLKSNG